MRKVIFGFFKYCKTDNCISFPILIAIVFHELSHGFVANRLGDPTAKMMGRLTLNPIAHIDPIGTILMPLMLIIFTNGQFVFGYAKPVPINPMNFKNPKRDMAISAAAGPDNEYSSLDIQYPDPEIHYSSPIIFIA